MDAQGIAVFMLVPACSLYALWVLMPTVARRWLAGCLLRLPGLRHAWRARLQRVALTASGCDCSGCDKAVKLRSPSPQLVIRIHSKPKA